MSDKNTKRNEPISEDVDMPEEYDLDHSRARPNRFADRLPGGKVVGVVLDPDVAAVFESSDAVNRFLRSAIEAMPSRKAEPVG